MDKVTFILEIYDKETSKIIDTRKFNYYLDALNYASSMQEQRDFSYIGYMILYKIDEFGKHKVQMFS